MRRIVYIQYTNPAGYPPLEHSSHLLAQAGWQVMFLGTGALGANTLIFPPYPNITVRQIPFCAPGWRQKLHYFQFCLWMLIWSLRWQPRWIYASDLLVCPIALALTLFPGIKVIYHEHDSPGNAPASAFLKLCLNARHWLAQRAEISILPNQERADRFDKTLHPPRSPLCVWNCPAKNEVAPQRLPWDHQTFWLLYHGSIVPSQLPETVLFAIKQLPSLVKLRVIGYETIGHPGYVKQLQRIADQLDIAERIEFLGTVPTRSELLQQCQSCDIGLAMFSFNGTQPMAGASNKPFDYLASGLPLVVSTLPDWEEMYVKPGYALACNPEKPDSIAEVLRWYLEHPDQMREMGDRGRKQILEEWNYEKQFSPVLERLLEVR